MSIKTNDVALREFSEGLKIAKITLNDACAALASTSPSSMNWHDFQKRDFDEIVNDTKWKLMDALEQLESTNKTATKMLVALDKYNKLKINK